MIILRLLAYAIGYIIGRLFRFTIDEPAARNNLAKELEKLLTK